MSLAVGVPLLECMYVAGCLRWAWKRCLYIGAYDSAGWNAATYEEFEPVPQICRIILSVYEVDLTQPVWAPPGGYGIKLEDIVKRVDYTQTMGRAPPYLVYVNHEDNDIILAIRGMDLGTTEDYKTLLDNRLGRQMFDGGYVHHGLLKSATWLLNNEAATLIELIEKYPDYTLTFAGHSLGSGVAALMTLVVAKNREAMGKISREKMRCFLMAPARCMSLNLALQYADIIHSIILQDDFLPRTATPLEDIFSVILCLPCVMTWRCCIDTCTTQKSKLNDERRLYAPGRMYHIVERRLCGCGRTPPEVRTSVPVDGRFDQVVLSCNATSDHSIVEIEKESEIALERMREGLADIPIHQKMERQQTIKEDRKTENKAALKRAVTLRIPFAFAPEHMDDDEETDRRHTVVDGQGNYTPTGQGSSSLQGNGTADASNWNERVERLFSKSNLEDPATSDSGRVATEVEDKSRQQQDPTSRQETDK